MIERVTRVTPRPRRLTADERIRLRAGELCWLLAWIVMAATFRGELGSFLCGLLCAWGLFEIERWVEAGRG